MIPTLIISSFPCCRRQSHCLSHSLVWFIFISLNIDPMAESGEGHSAHPVLTSTDPDPVDPQTGLPLIICPKCKDIRLIACTCVWTKNAGKRFFKCPRNKEKVDHTPHSFLITADLYITILVRMHLISLMYVPFFFPRIRLHARAITSKLITRPICAAPDAWEPTTMNQLPLALAPHSKAPLPTQLLSPPLNCKTSRSNST